jgi:hypothetical protein
MSARKCSGLVWMVRAVCCRSSPSGSSPPSANRSVNRAYNAPTRFTAWLRRPRASATSLTELGHHLGGLITQLRGLVPQPGLDYTQLYRDLVGDVERGDEQCLPGVGEGGGDHVGPPRGGDDLVAAPQRLADDLRAQALRGAGHEPHDMSLFPLVSGSDRTLS